MQELMEHMLATLEAQNPASVGAAQAALAAAEAVEAEGPVELEGEEAALQQLWREAELVEAHFQAFAAKAFAPEETDM